MTIIDRRYGDLSEEDYNFLHYGKNCKIWNAMNERTRYCLTIKMLLRTSTRQKITSSQETKAVRYSRNTFQSIIQSERFLIDAVMKSM